MNASHLALALVLVSLPATRPAIADGRRCGDFQFSCEAPVHWAPRHVPTDREFAITSEDGRTTLLLTRDALAVQLSDRTLHTVQRELRRQESEREDNAFGDILRAAVVAGVRRMLDHSAECEIRDLDDVDYRDGTLVLVANGGVRAMRHLSVDDRPVLAGFSEHSARAFVREFRLRKDQLR